MLIEEARWLGNCLLGMNSKDIFPLLNVGSGTLSFRTTIQPWIQEFIFAKMSRFQDQVTHLDQHESPGIDLSVDFLDGDLFCLNQFQSIMACNFLEHVKDVDEASKKLWSLVPPGGHLIVSCPYNYPYHSDPIDNGFRPTVQELSNLFPDGKIVHGQTVVDYSWTYYFVHHYSISDKLKDIGRLMLPWPNNNKWIQKWTWIPYIVSPFSATCLIMLKN